MFEISCAESECKSPVSLSLVCAEYAAFADEFAAQMQKESSLIMNNTTFDYKWRMNGAMGYYCKLLYTKPDGERITVNYGYEIQVSKGLSCMRKWYDSWTKGASLDLLSYEGTITPDNAGSYALYQYTPFYGEAVAFGHNTVGNRRFMAIWYLFQDEKNNIYHHSKYVENEGEQDPFYNEKSN